MGIQRFYQHFIGTGIGESGIQAALLRDQTSSAMVAKNNSREAQRTLS